MDDQDRTDQERRFPVVGIGASAGGVEALQALFRAMPEPPPAMAFVVVTHLGPGHESALPAILRDCTAMPVLPARDGTMVEPGRAYVLPHDAVITIAAGRLALRPQHPASRRERQPIDVFLASLAEELDGLAVGVVLSMHTRASLERFGAEAMIPAGLAMALVRETGPLTAGLLLA